HRACARRGTRRRRIRGWRTAGGIRWDTAPPPRAPRRDHHRPQQPGERDGTDRQWRRGHPDAGDHATWSARDRGDQRRIEPGGARSVAALARVAADLDQVAYEMTVLAERAGGALTPGPSPPPAAAAQPA